MLQQENEPVKYSIIMPLTTPTKKDKLSVPGSSRFGISKPVTGVGITLLKRRKKKKKKERKGNHKSAVWLEKQITSETAFFVLLVFCYESSPYF